MQRISCFTALFGSSYGCFFCMKCSDMTLFDSCLSEEGRQIRIAHVCSAVNVLRVSSNMHPHVPRPSPAPTLSVQAREERFVLLGQHGLIEACPSPLAKVENRTFPPTELCFGEEQNDPMLWETPLIWGAIGITRFGLATLTNELLQTSGPAVHNP